MTDLKNGGRATHYRTHGPSSYSQHEVQLRRQGVGLCTDCGGVARPLTKYDKFNKHNCTHAHPPANAIHQQHHHGSNARPEAWALDSPWPEGVSYPPPNTPHPLDVPHPKQCVKLIPPHCLENWANVVTTVSNNFANAVEQGSEQEIAASLCAFLGMSRTLEKPYRSGRSGCLKLARQMDQYALEFDVDVPSSCDNARAPQDEEASAIRRATAFLNAGYARKASFALRNNDSFCEPSPDVVARLQAKFPAPRSDIADLIPPPADAPLLTLEINDFPATLRKTINGAAGGRSGLTGEHLKVLLEEQAPMDALYRVTMLLANGRLPQWCQPYFSVQKLVALGEKARPICMAEFIVRAVGKIVDKTVNPKLSRKFFMQKVGRVSVLQVANNVPGGGEAAIHLIEQRVHEPNAGVVVTKLDTTNAYNSFDRVVGVNRTTSTFPTTHRWLHWWYGNAAMLEYNDADTTIIWGQEGGFQGGPLAGRIHDTGLQVSLLEVAQQITDDHSEEEVLLIAFRDDVHVVAKPVVSAATIVKYKEVLFSHLNLKTDPAKLYSYISRIGFPDEVQRTHAQAALAKQVPESRIREDGIKILGTPIGTHEYMEEQLTIQLDKYPLFLPRLIKMKPQHANYLLRLCYLPIATNLLRTVHPNDILQHARAFDTRILDTYKSINEDPLITRDHPLFELPFRHGGMAMRATVDVSPIAYFSSVVTAITTLKEFDTQIHDALALMIDQDENADEDAVNADGVVAAVVNDGDADAAAVDADVDAVANGDAAAAVAGAAAGGAAAAAHVAFFMNDPDDVVSVVAARHEAEDSNEDSGLEHGNSSASDDDEDDEAASVADAQPPDPHLQHPLFAQGLPAKLANAHQLALNLTFTTNPIDLFPTTISNLITNINSGGIRPKKLQKALTAQWENSRARTHTNSQSVEERACTLSQKNSCSNCVHNTIPTINNNALPPAAQRSTNKLRTRTLILPTNVCVCGSCTLNPSHALSCKKLRGRFVRHDVIVSLLASMLRAAGFVARAEVMVVDGTSMRMDIVVTLPTEVLWIDVSIINPEMATYLGKAKCAHQLREQEKIYKWEKHATTAGASFFPFVMETYGALGERADNLLLTIAQKAQQAYPYPLPTSIPVWVGQYKRQLKVQLAVALAHANHLMVEEACGKSTVAGWSQRNTSSLYSSFRSSARHSLSRSG
jgi:hypothetical protein